jgi:hypothetical protein
MCNIPALGAGQLIHQTAGLFKKAVFSPLGNLCQADSRNLALDVQLVEQFPHQHGKGRRGAQPGTRATGTVQASPEPADGISQG